MFKDSMIQVSQLAASAFIDARAESQMHSVSTNLPLR